MRLVRFKSLNDILLTHSSKEQSGAMLIMGYLSIVMFLFLTVLMLDVPYMERIGRSMQNCVDTAALAGTIQLTLNHSKTESPPLSGIFVRNTSERLRGWRNSKRAVFAFLKSNPILGADGLIIDNNNPDQSITERDPLDSTNYGYEKYRLDSGSLTGQLIISRGVYHRPNNWAASTITTFYKTEKGSNNWAEEIGIAFPDNIRCKADTSPDSPLHQHPAGTDHPNEPTECLASPSTPLAPDPSAPIGIGQPIIDVADAVQLTLTIDHVPTLFTKLLPGFTSSTSLTRTAVAVPE